jgi:hypothetical protein
MLSESNSFYNTNNKWEFFMVKKIVIFIFEG